MYNYENIKGRLFTETGQKVFLRIRDLVKTALNVSGAVMMENIINSECGDTWFLMACVDRLVELREIKEVTAPGTMGQHRVFISLTAHM